MVKKQISFLLFCVLFICLCNSINPQQVHRIYLTTPWQLKVHTCPQPLFNDLVLNTTIPTVLHLDLMANQKIPDPFFGDNYKQLQFVSYCNVSYSFNFTYDKQIPNADIVFQGIDTYSVIKLNGKLKAITNNSFVEYRIHIKREQVNLDQPNLIQVQITSTQRIDQAANSKNRMPFIYAHSRKAAYQYSWDWAPYLNTMGIWKPVYVQYYKDVKIDYVWVRNHQIRKKYAILNFATALNLAQNQQNIQNLYKIQIFSNGSKLGETQVLSKYVYADIRIDDPKFWWPNGIGEPNMYDFQVKLIKLLDSKQIDMKNVSFGIRTVKLDQTNNKFTVHVNGYPIYCKGANYVPPDMFYPRTTNPNYKPGNTYKKLLDDAVQSHFNMIRVWGGGQYQSDEFLQIASRKGIMLFYDFMFSDSIYPSTKQFLQNVQKQITQQVRRARNYPCLTLWSGNNEILQGIYSWGWSRQNYKLDYKRLFQQTIPAILQKQNPDIPYIPSSPVNGVGNGGFERGGDVHYWGVWAAGALFDAYKNALGPFNSQFGTQSIPVWETVKNFTAPQNRSYSASQFASHERHNSQFNTLTRYIKAYTHQSKNFELQAYSSGLVQAYGIQIAIKHQRISKPKSYGTLYWQFNDAWPAISWSSIDYFGRWKPLQYMAKRLYPDVAVFCADGKIVAVNDNLYQVQAVVLIKVQNLNGNILYNKTVTIQLAANQVKTVEQIKKSDYIQQLNSIVVYTEIISGRQKQMSSTFFFTTFKQLKVDPMARLYVKLIPEYNIIKLSTDKFIKNLYISSTKQYIKLSDNYFDMIANKVYKVVLDKQHKLEQIKSNLLFRSYMQIHSDIPIQVVYE